MSFDGLHRPWQVFLTETHLAVALEYADGGELFDAVARAGKLPEIEVGACHSSAHGPMHPACGEWHVADQRISGTADQYVAGVVLPTPSCLYGLCNLQMEL